MPPVYNDIETMLDKEGLKATFIFLLNFREINFSCGHNYAETEHYLLVRTPDGVLFKVDYECDTLVVKNYSEDDWGLEFFLPPEHVVDNILSVIEFLESDDEKLRDQLVTDVGNRVDSFESVG
jgi:hypothetical protein